MDYRIKRAFQILKAQGARAFTKKLLGFLRYHAGFFLMPFCLIKLRILRSHTDLDEKTLKFAYSGCCTTVRLQQHREEITKFMKLVKKNKPERIMEIGTADGGTLFLLTRTVVPNAQLISLDLPGGGYDKASYPLWKIPIFRSFALENQKIHLIRGNSHDTQTLNRIEKVLGNQSLDLLLIDGDHSYQGVKRDFEMYAPLVTENGLVAFHDIVTHPAKSGCRVRDFWQEIKEQYQHQEIVEPKKTQYGGFGVIRLNGPICKKPPV